MQQKNPAESFFSNMQNAFTDMIGTVPSSPFDIRTVLEAQRKNMQAVTEANQRALHGWQTLAQRQAEMVREFMQDTAGSARGALAEEAPKDHLARHADILKNACEKSITNSRELGEIMHKCTVETAEVLSQRMIANLSEIKSTAKTSE